MRRWFVAALVAANVVANLVVTPAWAAPGFTPPFRVAGSATVPAMTPDGTVAFPTNATVNSEFRLAVQVRPPGGPLGDVKLLSTAGATNPGFLTLAAGGDNRIVAAWIENGDVKVATLMPGAADFTSTATLTDNTADGVNVKADGAGNAYVVWTTRDDVNPGLQRQVIARLTKIPANGSAPTTEVLETFTTPSGVRPTLTVSYAVNSAGDIAFLKQRQTYDTGTNTFSYTYEGWTRPAGGSDTSTEDSRDRVVHGHGGHRR